MPTTTAAASVAEAHNNNSSITITMNNCLIADSQSAVHSRQLFVEYPPWRLVKGAKAETWPMTRGGTAGTATLIKQQQQL